VVSNLLIKGVRDEGYSKKSFVISKFDIFIVIPLLFFLDFIKSEDFCFTLNSSYKKYCIILSSWKKCSYVFFFKK